MIDNMVKVVEACQQMIESDNEMKELLRAQLEAAQAPPADPVVEYLNNVLKPVNKKLHELSYSINVRLQVMKYFQRGVKNADIKLQALMFIECAKESSRVGRAYLDANVFSRNRTEY